MRIRRIAISAAFATGIAALPLSAAQAQYYAPCSPFLLALPFCVAGAAVATAATIVTAPFWILSGAAPYGYYPPAYPAPIYSAPAYVPPAMTYAPAPASHASPPAQNAYYFCPASKAYYPYVSSCATAWRSVPVIPPGARAHSSG